MLLFGHIGITAAVARAGDIIFSPEVIENNKSGFRYRAALLLNRLRDASGRLDYRMIIVGSMLPDIIDKPVFLLLRDRGFEVSGRGYAHTLLFTVILVIGGVFLLRKDKSWLLTLGLSSGAHLVLDEIWDNLKVIFWPILGQFPPGETEGWLSGIWENLFTYPEVYIPEILGLIFSLYLAYKILRNRAISGFIRYGTIG